MAKTHLSARCEFYEMLEHHCTGITYDDCLVFSDMLDCCVAGMSLSQLEGAIERFYQLKDGKKPRYQRPKTPTRMYLKIGDGVFYDKHLCEVLSVNNERQLATIEDRDGTIYVVFFADLRATKK